MSGNRFDEIRDYWDQHARRDPLWAVLSESSRRGGRWDVARFFETGVHEIAAVLYQLDSRRIDLSRRSALDFGCGVGRLTQALAPHFDRIVGVDVSPRMLELAGEFNAFPSRVSYVLNQREDLSVFANATFDFIVSNIVLQHVPPDISLAYVAEFLRVLAPSGIAVFQLPSHRRTASDPAPPPRQHAMPDEAYQASIKPVGADALDLNPGGQITIHVEITNTSSQDWSAEQFGLMRAGNHWLNAGGDRMLSRDDGRSSLPNVVRSQETCRVPLTITAPEGEGDYRCAIDIAHEGVLWFHDKGSPLATVPVRVRARDRAQPASSAQAPARHVVPEREIDLSSESLQRAIDPGSADPGDFPMHGVPQPTVLDLIARNGATLIHIEDDTSAGADWVSFRYYVRVPPR